MTPAERALRDAWLSEMWTPVHELSREERAVDAARREVVSQGVDKPANSRGMAS